MLKNTFIIAIRAIFINKVRTLLTMLGIIIGVGSVVLLTSIGTGLQIYVSQQFENLGTNTLYVVPGNPFGDGGGFGNQEQSMLEATKATLKKKYLEQILRNLRGLITDGIATTPYSATIKYQQKSKKIVIYGIEAGYPIIQKSLSKTQSGAWFTKVDEKKAEAFILLGDGIAKELFGQVAPVGKKVKIDSQTFKVIGVLEKQGGSFGGPNFDNYIYMPLNTLQERFDTDYIDNFVLKAQDEKLVPAAKKAIEKELLKNLQKDQFTVFDQAQLLNTINSILGILTAGLGGIAAISLVVGGIGIMNIMLVSVTERTREVGLRKALGATPRLIMLQFLIEAALLSIIGGMIGVALAYGGSLILQSYFPAQVTLGAVALAFSVSAVVGIVFGVAPARKAANLSPIEALRYE